MLPSGSFLVIETKEIEKPKKFLCSLFLKSDKCHQALLADYQADGGLRTTGWEPLPNTPVHLQYILEQYRLIWWHPILFLSHCNQWVSAAFQWVKVPVFNRRTMVKCLNTITQFQTMESAASIWFEIWGSWIQVKIFKIFPGKFKKIVFFRQFQTKKSMLSRQVKKNSIFPGKFSKNFYLSRQFH